VTEPLSEPPVPPDCDLRDFPFLPLEVRRLLDSDLFALSSGEEFKAAVALLCKAWQQIPAASLPDDDRVLAHLSGAGRRWPKVKTMALRGFVKCSDGRLYHPVLTVKALDAWERKKAQRQRTAAARAARHPSKQPPSVTDFVTETVTGSKGQGEGKGQRQQQQNQKRSPSDGRSDVRRSAPWGADEDQALAHRIFAAVKIVAPSAREPKWNGWANAIRLMREEDERTYDEIWALFEWANRDTFWRTVILSPGSLRGKWTQLDAKRGAGARKGVAPPTVVDLWKGIGADGRF